MCCFYLTKSTQCNGQNVTSFSLKHILQHLLYLLKFNLLMIVPEELMNFKLRTIPGNSVYINLIIFDKALEIKKFGSYNNVGFGFFIIVLLLERFSPF